MEVVKKLHSRWQERANMGDNDLARQELAFLPAALEIKEKPPHPASRVTAYVLLALFTIGLVWACVGEVDIVATAEGKIIPSGQVKLIQPFERGVVSNILVKDGQLVKAGDPLVELDRGQTGANQKRIEQEVTQNRLNMQRLGYFKQYLDRQAGLSNPASETHPTEQSAKSNQTPSHNPVLTKDKQSTIATKTHSLVWPEASNYQQQQQTLLLMQQQENFRAEQSRLFQLIIDKEAEQQVNAALINKLKGTLPLISQRVSALKKLMQQKMAARVQYLELEQLRIEQQQDLIGAKARNRQLKAQFDELKQQNQALIARTRSENLQELLQTDREYLSLGQELNKANDLNKKQILTSPVNGVVQELAIHTIGGVVTEAQTLMKIVPENQQLEVEAWLENKDIGFVSTQQSAEVKIHTFNFTKYGIIDGHVETISSDATVDEQRGLIYKAKVLLTKNSLMVDGREVPLVPGMGVSAEIKIGKRLLIEYITAPLLRYKSESLSEK
ncbi:HlyD family type I secretion periplasmic adaptor subunit [Neptuniibacter sp. 2_MG-2023]|uniref:HlyD family type I secretion periplasmic adaptor subunit n=1 Tax=Neptuniibacter sp. 2_MG-2023 TaxID=3062671 RepID=UPI0026E19B54|nr:HlyD family type I secretion periplasmic adaptor subunit [Neptuniibacter sp. 2_MG-2023]MDO6515156.1 HlyD family type I secretion periplasmic adaptor subunit [Neptuniibacter sp. 2_MG-2023]